MRTLCQIVLFLLMIRSASGEERTWTIATDVYRTEAELVAVRGEMAYLRIAGKVEGIALERLSAADHKYIASLALAPVSPGPVSDGGESGGILPGPAGDGAEAEMLPLPGGSAARLDHDLFGPEVAPSYADPPPNGRQPAQATVYRTDESGRTTILPPAGNPDDRRFWRLPPQGPTSGASNSLRDEDEPRGLRARRLERQRANAAAAARRR
jgi:hypothetical protein